VLSARIDRLTPQDKRLLQVASVVGKDVPLVLLQAIAELPDEALGRGLDHLQAAEFLYETGLFPEIEYTFKHAVTHEVTYSGLLRERRRELHARIVDAIETFQRDRLAEHIERLAHHAVRGELGEKAVPYLERAGNKAAERSALQDARGWFEQALSVLETLPASRSTLEQAFDVRLKLRVVLNLLGDIREQLHCLRGAETLAERLNDDHRRGRVCSFMTNLYSLLGELDNALMAGARALDIAGRLGDLELRILSTSYLVQAHHLRGDHERVVELATGNLAALPDDWIYKYLGRPAPPSIFDRFYLVMSLAEVGKLKEAAARAAEAIRLTEPMQQQHWNSVGLAYYATAALQVAEGDWAKARLAIQRALEVFRTGNIVIMHRYSVAAFCRILAEAGEATDALIQLQEGERLLEHHTASGIFGHRGDAYHSLGRAGLLLGRLDDARRFAQCAIESSSQQQGCTAHTLHLIGDIVTHPSRLDAESSESLYYRALGLAEPRGMRPLVAHCHAGLAKLYHRTGKHEQAQEHLTTATTMYREMGMTYWLEKAQAMD